MMKRLMRRSAAVATGLTLGWLAQGWTTGWWPQPNEVHAEEPAHDDHDLGHEHESGKAHSDQGADAAKTLADVDRDLGWYKNALYAAGGLFVAAVAVGVPASRMRGPQEVEDHSGRDAVGAH